MSDTAAVPTSPEPAMSDSPAASASTQTLPFGSRAERHSAAAARGEDRFEALDGLRGVAVLFVMLYHFGTAVGFGEESFITRKIVGVFCNLWTGVDIFFTLSGFLITGILLRVKHEPGYFSKFYMRRTLRIFPLYYLSMVVLFVVLPLLDLPALDNPDIERVRAAQGWMWAYAQDFAIAYYNEDFFDPDPLWVGHFWSLGVEEHFYLVWPVIVYACSPRGLFRACLLMIVSGIVVRFTMIANHMDVAAVYTFTFSRMDELAIGGLLALGVQCRQRAELVRWAKWGAAGASAYLAGSVIYMRKPFYWTYTTSLGFGFTALAVGTASLIVFATSPEPNLVRRSLEVGWLRTFGKYSYGAYVLHTPLQVTWQRLFSPRMLGEFARPLGHTATQLVGLLGFVGIAIGLTLLLAVISFHLFEQPFNRLKRHFEFRESQLPVPTAAPSATPGT
jgi:peptidoglycan/LPS O-acetylase OafA/YrhL